MQALHQDAVDAGITVVNEVKINELIQNSNIWYFDVSLIAYFIKNYVFRLA